MKRLHFAIAKAIAALVACFAACLLVASPARAAIILVNDPVDFVGVNGLCSLREAILSMNAGGPINPDCAPIPSPPFGVADMLLLGVNTAIAVPGVGENMGFTGDYDIRVPLTIVAAPPFAGLMPFPCLLVPPLPPPCVSGGGLDRVFDILAPGVNFQGFSIAGGAAPLAEDGGAIRIVNPAVPPNGGVPADLTMTNVFVARSFAMAGPGDRGGGVWNNGTLNASTSVIFQSAAQFHGGGIYNDISGTVKLDNSQVFQNRSVAGNGGGIYNDGDLSTQNGTLIFENVAFADGGGIFNSTNGNSNLMRSAVYVNGVGGANVGGGIANEGKLTGDGLRVYSNTLAPAADGGGIFNKGSVVLKNDSRVFDNIAANGGGISSKGTFSMSSSSVTSNTASASGGAGIYNSGEFDMLNSLVATNTIAVAGNVGAGVWNAAGAFTATTSSIENNSGADMGGGVANDLGATFAMSGGNISNHFVASMGGGVRNLGAAMLGGFGSIDFNNAPLAGGGILNTGGGSVVANGFVVMNNFATDGGGVWSDSTFDASAARIIINSAGNQGGGAFILASGVATFQLASDVSFNMASLGGGVANDGRLLVRDSQMTGNFAQSGGAVYGGNSSATRFDNALTTDNNAVGFGPGLGNGGGVFVGTSGVFTADNFSRFIENDANYAGGALFEDVLASAWLKDARVISNTAQNDGGGAHVSRFAALSVVASDFVTNTVSMVVGGGIYNGGALIVERSRFDANRALLGGGGIQNDPGATLGITHTTFFTNRVSLAFGTGGALRNEGLVAGEYVTMTDNAGFACGGVDNQNVLSASLWRAELNTAVARGGGGCNRGQLMFDRAHVLLNDADRGGGLAVTIGAPTELIASRFERNSASDLGGGVFVESSPITLSAGSVISANNAGVNGGGVFVASGTDLRLFDTNVFNNGAGQDGGGVYAGSITVNLTTTVAISGGAVISNTAGRDGGGVVISGNVRLRAPPLVPLTFDQMRLESNLAGRHGGGIKVESFFDVFYEISPVLSISNGVVISNAAGMNGGGMNLLGGKAVWVGSEFRANGAGQDGGGIATGMTTTLELEASSVHTNTAQNGGGLRTLGRVRMDRSAIFDNAAVGSGGGWFNLSMAEVTNTTFSRNASMFGGGIINSVGIADAGNVTLTNVTIARNAAPTGAGLHVPSPLSTQRLKNTLVADNVGGNCGLFGPVTSLGHNLDSGNTCGLTGTGDLVNAAAMLGPLQMNPPGNTPTHALMPGSMAKNTGDNMGCPPTDQRGVARPVGLVCDIGAYEAQAVARAYVPSVRRDSSSGW